MVKKSALSACVLMLPLLVSAAANARPYGPEVQPRDSIVCRDGFQSVEGRSVATPRTRRLRAWLASLARGSPRRQSANNPDVKHEACRFVRADIRVRGYCGGR
jgi:hypothetical protein